MVGAPDACAIDWTREKVAVDARRTPRVGPEFGVGKGAAFFVAVEPIGAGEATTA